MFAVASVIGVFLSINRRGGSDRIRYWIVAWTLVLVHFGAQIASGLYTGIAGTFAVSVSVSTLELAGVVLLLSLSLTFKDRKANRYLGCIIGGPLMIYVNCLIWNVQSRWIFVLCILVTTAGAMSLYIRFIRSLAPVMFFITAWCAVTAAWLIRDVQTGDGSLALYFSLTGLFTICGLIFWRSFRRFSAGVVLSSFGFLAWAAVFPTALFLATHHPEIKIHPEMWNIPKFFVAVGMLLTQMETESIKAGAMALNYKSLFELNVAAVYRISLEGQLLDCNPAFLRMFGFSSREEALTTNTRDLYAVAGDRKRYLDDICERGYVHSYEIRTRKRDGTYCWISESATLMREVEPPVILATAVDITPRREAEAALRSSEERFSTIFRKSPIMCAILRFDNGAFLDVNETFLEVMNKTREEVIGKTGVDVGFWQNEEQRGEFARQLRLQGSVQNIRVTFRDGKGRQKEGLYSAESAEVGGMECIIGMMTDMTDYKALEDQLRQTQKLEAIGRLAAGIAHDFNNVLCIIKGFGELVVSHIQHDRKIARYLNNLLEAVERGAGLTQQLLTFSKTQRLQKTEFEADEAVQRIANLLLPLLGEDILLSVTAESGQMVEMDPSQFEQIVVNLAVNARDAMPRGGRLSIGTSFMPGKLAHGAIRLTVSDTGCGMSESTRRRLFEPFFTTKPVGKGTGLGLATVYGIVTQVGGEITVESSEGVGSTFVLFIAATASAQRAQIPEQAASAIADSVSHGTILVVEDEPPLRDALYEYLTESGYTVRVAANGKEALAIAKTFAQELRVVITDVVMPEMSGWDLVQELKRKNYDFEYILVSGYADDRILQYGVKTAGLSFLQKPYSFPGLISMVEEKMKSERPEKSLIAHG